MLTAEEKEAHKQNYKDNKQSYIDRARAWKKKNPGKRQLSNRKNFLKRTYGITWEQYISMYNEAEAKCAVCKKFMQLAPKQDDRDESACVDHNHATGKVRGLLCRRCNIAIGFLDENIDRFQNAIEYLRKYEST